MAGTIEVNILAVKFFLTASFESAVQATSYNIVTIDLSFL